VQNEVRFRGGERESRERRQDEEFGHADYLPDFRRAEKKNAPLGKPQRR
jgi:hypothetical protein